MAADPRGTMNLCIEEAVAQGQSSLTSPKVLPDGAQEMSLAGLAEEPSNLKDILQLMNADEAVLGREPEKYILRKSDNTSYIYLAQSPTAVR